MYSKFTAAVLRDNSGKVNITSIKIPELKKKQVLVRILYTGICGTQINEILGRKGKDKYFPHTLGHEAVGIVVKVADKKSNLKKNDKVILSWIKSSVRDSSLPKYQNKNEVINSGPISTFMNYTIVSENRVFKIKTKLDNSLLPLLGCAIPTSIGVFKNIIKHDIRRKKIGVFGCGGIGLLSLCYLIKENNLVYGLDINNRKLNLAKKIGAITINVQKLNKLEILKKLNGPLDLVIDTSGSKKSLQNAFELIKKNGKLIISSNLKKGDKISIDPFGFIAGKNIIGNWGGKSNLKKDLPFFLNFLKKEKNFLKNNFIKVYKFSKINYAIKDMIKGKVVRPIIKL